MHAVNRPLHLLLEGLVDFLALRRASCEPGFLAQHFGSLAAVVTLDLRARMNALEARLAGMRRLHGSTVQACQRTAICHRRSTTQPTRSTVMRGDDRGAQCQAYTHAGHRCPNLALPEFASDGKRLCHLHHPNGSYQRSRSPRRKKTRPEAADPLKGKRGQIAQRLIDTFTQIPSDPPLTQAERWKAARDAAKKNTQDPS